MAPAELDRGESLLWQYQGPSSKGMGEYLIRRASFLGRWRDQAQAKRQITWLLNVAGLIP